MLKSDSKARALHEKLESQKVILGGLKFSMQAIGFLYWEYDVKSSFFLSLYRDKGTRGNSYVDIIARFREDERHKADLFFQSLLAEKKRSDITLHFMPWTANHYIPYEITAIVECDDLGKPTRIYGVSKDISDKIQYEQQIMNKVSTLISIKDSLPLGMAFFDKHGFLKDVNNKHIEMFGTKKTEIINGCLNFFNFKFIPHQCLEDLRAGKCTHFTTSSEVLLKSFAEYSTIKSDTNRIVYMRYSPIRTKLGELIGFMSLCEDKTDEYTLIEQLKDARNKAVEADRLKTAFLANISHEVRTPLNAIVGFSELILTEQDEEVRNEFISIIKTNTSLLLRLIDDILDMSKIESGLLEFKRERFDLSLAFDEIYDVARVENSNPNVTYVEEVPYQHCYVSMDKGRLIQVIMNFITNAKKYTHEGTITIGYVCQDGGIKIYVKDTGTGIPNDKQHFIFNRFRKAHPFVQGIGLGLTISKAIMDALGGNIGFESEEGKGTTFWAWAPGEAEIN